jgi:hypothetical protein
VLVVAAEAYVAVIPSPGIIPVIEPLNTGFAVPYILEAGFGVTVREAGLTLKTSRKREVSRRTPITRVEPTSHHVRCAQTLVSRK